MHYTECKPKNKKQVCERGCSYATDSMCSLWEVNEHDLVLLKVNVTWQRLQVVSLERWTYRALCCSMVLMLATSSLIRDSRSATSALAVACVSSSWVTTISCSGRGGGKGEGGKDNRKMDRGKEGIGKTTTITTTTTTTTTTNRRSRKGAGVGRKNNGRKNGKEKRIGKRRRHSCRKYRQGDGMGGR